MQTALSGIQLYITLQQKLIMSQKTLITVEMSVSRMVADFKGENVEHELNSGGHLFLLFS